MHVLDFGGGGLAVLAGLPHVGTVADRQQPDLVRRIVAEADRRAGSAGAAVPRAPGVGSVEEFRARRAAGEFPDEPATDLLLVVDGYLVLRGEFDDLEARLLPLAAQGLSYGLHLAVSANRWSELRPALKDLLGSRVELRLGEPGESEVDRRRAAGGARTAGARAGAGRGPDGAGRALVVRTGTSGGERGTGDLVRGRRRGLARPVVRPGRRCCRTSCTRRHPRGCRRLRSHGAGIPIGVDEEGLARVEVDLAGRSAPGLLRRRRERQDHPAAGAGARPRPGGARRTRRGSWSSTTAAGCSGRCPASHLLVHASTADAAEQAARDVAASLRGRLPGADVGPRELRERSWWSGPGGRTCSSTTTTSSPPTGWCGVNPLLPLVEFLPQAKDVGLHLVVARRCGGAGRALFDPLLGRLRELAAPGLVMNGSPDEGALVGHGQAAAAAARPGRARRPPARYAAGPARLAAAGRRPRRRPVARRRPAAVGAIRDRRPVSRVAVQLGAAWVRVAVEDPRPRLLTALPVRDADPLGVLRAGCRRCSTGRWINSSWCTREGHRR